jgi:hypothetical protein
VIPAILAAPLVEGVIGQVVNCLTPASNSAPAASAPTFSPYLNRAATAAVQTPPSSSPSGIMRADQWNQMAPTDMQSWAKSLTGRHVDATDASGKTISGVVSGMQHTGNTFALNIGGHLVSLSQLKQVTWSPSTV